MKVHWLRAAVRNLIEQEEYIARDDPDAAERIVTRVYEAVDRLALQPASGRPGRVPGTRELVVSGTPFVIPYRVRENGIEVLRVLHGARR